LDTKSEKLVHRNNFKTKFLKKDRKPILHALLDKSFFLFLPKPLFFPSTPPALRRRRWLWRTGFRAGSSPTYQNLFFAKSLPD